VGVAAAEVDVPGITGKCLTVEIYSDGPNKQTHWAQSFFDRPD